MSQQAIVQQQDSKPLSLRLRKKAQQRTELLRVAALLFRRQGYEETRMEDIARQANVSTKTVYNYFVMKQKILFELLDEDRRKLSAAYEEVASDPPDDLAEALALLIRADIGDVLTVDDKKLWRELLAAAMRAHDRAKDEFEINRAMFTCYIERVLRHFQERGKLSSSVSLPIAVDMIYAINAHNFRQYCAVESCMPDDVLELARQQMREIVASWLPDDREHRMAGRQPRVKRTTSRSKRHT